MKSANSIYAGLSTSIFEVMSRLAKEHGAINLGQGFPDTDGPEDIKRFAAEEIIASPNQYPPMMGVPELRKAVAEANRRFYGLEVDWQSEVMVTSGATEALSDCLAALIEPGDEVVLIEPLYDCYLPLVLRAGATPRFVRVTPPDWRIDPDALAAAFSGKTKAILLNNPMNPAGKVFTADELALIAETVIRFDAFAICDEVYEHIVFDGRRHVPLMTLPGMRERSVRIGSAGKTFSLTGWKVGYVTAAEKPPRPDRQGAPVHHLHDARLPAEGGRLRPRQGGRLLSRASPATSRSSATISAAPWRGSASAWCPARAPTSSPPTWPPSASTATMSPSARR